MVYIKNNVSEDNYVDVGGNASEAGEHRLRFGSFWFLHAAVSLFCLSIVVTS